jgi:16S rRNA (adenine1518-N6/adenine1519-N6)-dimethyltransferase
MLDSSKKSTISELRNKYDFQFSKRFGQNLLANANIIEKIIEVAEINAQDTVIEIGPGFGALTSRLSKTAKRVVAVEIDRRMMPILEEVLRGADNVEIINVDFMRYDLSLHAEKFILAGNLPYYITTPIIAKVLEGEALAQRLVFMVQKELAERLCAPPGNKKYGAISVLVQYHTHAEIAMQVPKTVFIPQPNVDSAVIRLTPYVKKPVQVKSEKMFFSLVKAGFGQRRKMLRNALGALNTEKEKLEHAFKIANIDPELRAESLGVAEFAALADALSLFGE